MKRVTFAALIIAALMIVTPVVLIALKTYGAINWPWWAVFATPFGAVCYSFTVVVICLLCMRMIDAAIGGVSHDDKEGGDEQQSKQR